MTGPDKQPEIAVILAGGGVAHLQSMWAVLQVIVDTAGTMKIRSVFCPVCRYRWLITFVSFASEEIDAAAGK